jgi:hypothetical protein
MKPRSLPCRAILLSALVASPVPAAAIDPGCRDSVCRCPLSSYGWTRFEDENRCTPDFWWIDSVTVREIVVCEHGVQFLFVVDQHGESRNAALVFPNPTHELLVDRLDLEPGSAMLESEFRHFRQRFDNLTGSLERISGGALRAGSRVTFPTRGRARPPEPAPIIVPKERLELLWRGAVLKLRGYLDVYFSVVV